MTVKELLFMWFTGWELCKSDGGSEAGSFVKTDGGSKKNTLPLEAVLGLEIYLAGGA